MVSTEKGDGGGLTRCMQLIGVKTPKSKRLHGYNLDIMPPNLTNIQVLELICIHNCKKMKKTNV